MIVDISTKRGEARKTFLTRRNISELRSNTWGIRGTKPSIARTRELLSSEWQFDVPAQRMSKSFGRT